MNRVVSFLILGVLAVVAALAALDAPPKDQPAPVQPAPVPAPVDPPCPGPGPCPPRRPRPWGDQQGSPVGASVGGRVAPDGTPLQIDLPGDQHLKNKGGSDGAGLCVFTSVDHAARWANEPALIGMRDWMTRHPGGGWPRKLDEMIAKICQERGLPVPPYLNVEGLDLELIQRACAAGHVVCVTYSRSPTGRYGAQKIAHMVNVVHAQNGYYAVLDNNFPGDNAYEWLSEAEFRKAHASSPWVVVLLKHGPPSPPRN